MLVCATTYNWQGNFLIFSVQFNTSVTPVTQNHFYTINAAKDNEISHNTMQNFVNLAISKCNQYSEPREINNDVEGSDFDIVSLSFMCHGLMFANTNVGSRMLYNIQCILAAWQWQWQPPGW